MCLIESELRQVGIPNLVARIEETVLFPVPEVPPSIMTRGVFLSIILKAI